MVYKCPVCDTIMNNMIEKIDTSKNILQLIAEAARANLSAVAVKTPEHSITYGRLIFGAMAIANEIDSRRPNDNVILVEASRCQEFIMTILGIMLTRRAFVPVSSTWPRSRIEMLKKKLGVYEEPLKMMQIVDLIKPTLVTRISNFESYASKVKMSDPAYCICTSGSTGEPKCIEILHQGIPNLVANQAKIFDSNPKSCFLWMLSPVFDGSFSDIFVALASGSTIAIDPIIEMPEYTWRAAEDAKATHIDIPPALLEILSPSELPKSVECLIVGGQQLSKNIVERYASKCKVVNVYGPTEATICTSAKVYDKTNYDAKQISIGLPFEGVDYKIAKDGELLIGGVQLASRYVGDPDLTARKFFVDGRERKWYRTGDEVDCLGEYFFIGRLDRQFKVNGKLVAPEEIEAAAAKHGMIAAVVEHAGKIKCLVENPRPAMMNQKPIVMRIFKDELPEWMVPSRVKFVESLPRLQVGKVDYAAVARMFDSDAQEVVDLDQEETTEGPTTILGEVKKMMADIIHSPVSSNLSFKNDLGADSIQQIMLSLKIKSKWNIQLTASDFKVDDSATGIAAVLEKKMNGNDAISASELQSRVDAIARDIDDNLCGSKKDLVVVTGVAGFLGSQVLSMLLNKWQKVVCIVKASDDVDAKKKVIEALESKVGMTLAKPDRVICYAGDLSKDRFGLLNSSTYDMLCQKTELVYHIAGEVNDWKAAEDLAASNIEATKNVIQFCKRSNAKLVFASTLSVFVSRSDLPSAYTCYEVPLEEDGVIVGGYAQSKWIAEKLVLDTMQNDNVRVMRYGLLTEPTDKMMKFKQSTLSMFLRGLRKIHVAPYVKTELRVDFTPVDIAAAVTTRAFKSTSKILHVHAGMQVKFADIAAKVLSDVPYPPLNYEVWKKNALEKLEESGYDKDIAVCIEALAREEGCKFGPFDLFQSTGMVFARSGTFEVYDEALVKLENDAQHNYVDKLLRTDYAEADKDW